MTRGIKIQDVTVGTGDEALRGKTVVANVRMFLNHGTELTGTFLGGQKMRIDLRKRECIAGLQYGIEGMRVGGVRSLIISPHLAYGAKGYRVMSRQMRSFAARWNYWKSGNQAL